MCNLYKYIYVKNFIKSILSDKLEPFMLHIFYIAIHLPYERFIAELSRLYMQFRNVEKE